MQYFTVTHIVHIIVQTRLKPPVDNNWVEKLSYFLMTRNNALDNVSVVSLTDVEHHLNQAMSSERWLCDMLSLLALP